MMWSVRISLLCRKALVANPFREATLEGAVEKQGRDDDTGGGSELPVRPPAVGT